MHQIMITGQQQQWNNDFTHSGHADVSQLCWFRITARIHRQMLGLSAVKWT